MGALPDSSAAVAGLMCHKNGMNSPAALFVDYQGGKHPAFPIRRRLGPSQLSDARCNSFNCLVAIPIGRSSGMPAQVSKVVSRSP